MDAFEGHLGTGAHDVAIHVDHADDWQADSTAGRAGEGCTLTIDGETTIRTGTWHTPIIRVMMVFGGGVTKGLDIWSPTPLASRRSGRRAASRLFPAS